MKRSPARLLLGGAAAAGLLGGRRPRCCAQAPAADAVTPALIEAAKKEGKRRLVRRDGPAGVASASRKAFEAKYPGISVRIERTGSERQFQRLAQEYGSKIHAADVINASDAAHFIVWKRNGWLAPYVPEEVAQILPGRAPRRRRPVCIVAHLCGRRSPTTPTW